ncbi:MAG TPA: DUF6572 domain-containing protein [Polyangia bacterium]
MNQAGVQNPKMIDLVTSKSDGTSVLLMIEERPWDGSDERLDQLQAKVNSYVSYALDGYLENQFPETAGMPFELRLDCASEPDQRSEEFIRRLNQALAKYGTRLEVAVR